MGVEVRGDVMVLCGQRLGSGIGTQNGSDGKFDGG
jgi:hypothetical protein